MKTPFKFLDPYELKDKESYFGREEEVKILYSMVTRNRITFIYGPSGIGKTSLVQCGLASRFGSVDWLPLWIRQGDNINTSLRNALVQHLESAGLIYDQDDSNTSIILQLFNRYLRPIYLIFDQFEELFILNQIDGSGQRLQFYYEIDKIIVADLPCRIIFIMREDYFGHLNHFEKIIPELYHRKLRVEPMSRDNLLRVIKGSCSTFGISFDDSKNAPETILDYINGDNDTTFMPYLQVYLRMLYQEAYYTQYGDYEQTDPPRAVKFTNTVIHAVGPISDVLSRYLKEQEDEIIKYLQSQYSGVPEDLVHRILDIFVTKEGTKIPLSYRSSGKDYIIEGKRSQRLSNVPNAWISTCLKELEKREILRQTDNTFEVAHDSLASLIDQQRSLEQRQLNEIRRRLETAYREHLDAAGTYFLDRGQLARIELFLPKLGLEDNLLQFIRQSEAEVVRKTEAEREEEREKLRLTEEKLAVEAKGRRKQILFSYIIGVVALVAIVAGSYGHLKSQEAERQTIVAIEQAEIAKEKSILAEEKTKTVEELLQTVTDQKIMVERYLQELKDKEKARSQAVKLQKEAERKNIPNLIVEITDLLKIDETEIAKIKLYEALNIDPNNSELLTLLKKALK